MLCKRNPSAASRAASCCRSAIWETDERNTRRSCSTMDIFPQSQKSQQAARKRSKASMDVRLRAAGWSTAIISRSHTSGSKKEIVPIPTRPPRNWKNWVLNCRREGSKDATLAPNQEEGCSTCSAGNGCKDAAQEVSCWKLSSVAPCILFSKSTRKGEALSNISPELWETGTTCASDLPERFSVRASIYKMD